MAAPSVVRGWQDDPVLRRGAVHHLHRHDSRGLRGPRDRRARTEPTLRRGLRIGRETMARNALVVGAGDGISASFARALARDGFKVGLAARRTDKLASLCDEIGLKSRRPP